MNDPWVVATPKPAFYPLPVGSYRVDFQGVEDVKLQDGSMKWRFVWKVNTGPEAGKLASTLCNQSISPASLPGVLIAGLLGRALVAGENVKNAVDSCIGKSYMVSVQLGPKGGKPCVRMVAALP